jgi:hypothetical protein
MTPNSFIMRLLIALYNPPGEVNTSDIHVLLLTSQGGPTC